MKALTQSVLAAAMLVAFPFAAAEACSKNAWNGNTTAADGALASGPAAAVVAQRIARYSEGCALQTSAGQFVIDNTPNAEATYRARFYVFTSGTGKVFSATTENGGAGTEVVGVTFNGSAFSFSGATGVGTVAAVGSRWYEIQILTQQNGAFSASVRGNGAASATTVTGTSANATVGSAVLGLLAGGVGNVIHDSFESTRSASTAIPSLCRGNANVAGASANTRDINDVTAIIAEINRTAFSAGQPDFTEDGQVNINDVTAVIGVINSVSPGC